MFDARLREFALHRKPASQRIGAIALRRKGIAAVMRCRDNPAQPRRRELCTQTANMNCKAVGLWTKTHLPYFGQELVWRHRAPWCLCKPPQQRELARVQAQSPPIHHAVAQEKVEVERTVPAPAGHRFDRLAYAHRACFQFVKRQLRREGLPEALRQPIGPRLAVIDAEQNCRRACLRCRDCCSHSQIIEKDRAGIGLAFIGRKQSPAEPPQVAPRRNRVSAQPAKTPHEIPRRVARRASLVSDLNEQDPTASGIPLQLNLRLRDS